MNAGGLYGNTSPQAPRSRPYQTQTLNRQSSRNFYDQSNHNALYGDDDIYDGPRINDRMNHGMSSSYGYDVGMPQAWNNMSYGQNNQLAALGATVRGNPAAAQRGRNPLPSTWLDQPTPVQPASAFGPFGGSGMGLGQSMRTDQLSQDSEEDLIPTAIVIKNIPFAVKKEQLVQVMTDLNLPLPYAFNYHFDNGVFRGLAFANFTTAEETAAVIQGMNHLELHGRKLRVEYKKMLPQAERDRIEREKRERRGQLEEQHRPMGPATLQPQSSLSSLNSHMPAASPSPVSSRPQHGLDMNDPTVLGYYSKLILFQGDVNQGEIIPFPADLPAAHRKIIHGLAHQLGLGHISHGDGNNRSVHVYRNSSNVNGLSPTLTTPVNPIDQQRRQLNRAATTDFTNVRNQEQGFYNNYGNSSASYLGGFGDSSTLFPGRDALRGVKSFADLRSNNPSPAQSNSSFPVGLTSNIARFQDHGPGSPGSSRSNVTPTTTTMPESLLGSMSGLSITSGFGSAGGPGSQRLRGVPSWDQPTGPGPIGGHRTASAAHDDSSRNRSQGPIRQPRGPPVERSGSGLQRGRQNGHQARGSDELSSPSGVEIVVE